MHSNSWQLDWARAISLASPDTASERQLSQFPKRCSYYSIFSNQSRWVGNQSLASSSQRLNLIQVLPHNNLPSTTYMALWQIQKHNLQSKVLRYQVQRLDLSHQPALTLRGDIQHVCVNCTKDKKEIHSVTDTPCDCINNFNSFKSVQTCGKNGNWLINGMQ